MDAISPNEVNGPFWLDIRGIHISMHASSQCIDLVAGGVDKPGQQFPAAADAVTAVK